MLGDRNGLWRSQKKEKENRNNPGANGVAVSGAHLQRGCPEL
jgi:hypothetical protein